MEFHEIANIFPMMTGDDYKELREDIKTNGLIEPIILYEGKILDGRNRYTACLDAGVEAEYGNYEGNNPIQYVISKNLNRRHLTSSQRAAISLQVEEQIAEEARKRQQGGQGGILLSQIFEKASDPIHAAEEAAKLLGTNRQYVHDAKKIKQEAPELLDKVIAGEMTIPQAKSEIRRYEQVEKAVALAAPELPNKRYSIIYADPPWRYDFSNTTNREIENQYPTMSTEEICELDIPKLCADDCVLFLWATNPKLEQAFEVIYAWGFRYKTNMVWIKDKIGMGYYARQRHELLLIATKGSLSVPLPQDRPDSVIQSPRSKHSEKPDIVYSIIEGMYPDMPKIELFSRNKKEGWETWGNQI